MPTTVSISRNLVKVNNGVAGGAVQQLLGVAAARPGAAAAARVVPARGPRGARGGRRPPDVHHQVWRVLCWCPLCLVFLVY